MLVAIVEIEETYFLEIGHLLDQTKFQVVEVFDKEVEETPEYIHKRNEIIAAKRELHKLNQELNDIKNANKRDKV